MSETPKNVAAEVGVKLVLDSNAKSEAQHIKDGLRGVEHGTEKAAKGWKQKLGGAMSYAGSAAAMGLSVAVSAAAAAGAAMIGFGTKSAHAYLESEEQVRSLAGTLTLIDQKGNAFEDLMGLADDTKNELEELAMQAGVTDDAMVQVFDDIVERGGKGVEEAKELAGQMAYAGRAIKGGPQALAAGFEQLQMGMIRAKNPLVQLIASTGTLKGSAKAVAKEMQGMAIDEQMKLAEKAIAAMSEKMKKAPMTIPQMLTSMQVAVGNAFEEAGKPIVEHLAPAVEKVKDLFVGSDGLNEAAGRIGEFMGRGIDIVVPVVEQMIRGVREAWDDVSKAFDDTGIREIFEYIYENKEAFARTIGDAVKLLVTGFSYVVRAVLAVRNAVFGLLKSIGKSGVLGTDFARFIGEEEQKGQRQELRGKINKLSDPNARLSEADIGSVRSKYIESARSSGMNVEDASADFDKQYRMAMDAHQKTMSEVAIARDAALMDDAKQFAKAFNLATKANDEGAMKYAASFLAGNAAMANAIAKEGPAIFEGGMAKLFDALKANGTEGADTAKLLKEKMKPNLGITPKTNLVQNFNGAINIKQDFRDQDPDRVAITFKRELGKVGSNRLQSRVAAPFGF